MTAPIKILTAFFDLDNTLVYVAEPNTLSGDPIAWDYPRCLAKKVLAREFGLAEEQALTVFERIREDLRSEGELGWFEAFSVMTALGLEYPLTQDIIEFEKRFLRVYPDSESALRDLMEKGLKIWIISENGERHTRLKLVRSGLINYITGIIGSDTYGGPKKTLLPYVGMLRDLKLSSEDVAMVGDSYELDIESAHRAGLRKLFLIDRNQSREMEFRGNHTVINRLTLLPKMLTR